MAGSFGYRAYAIDLTGLRTTALTEGALPFVLQFFTFILIERA